MFTRRFAVRGIAAAASLTLIATARAGMDDCPPPTRVVLEGVATPVLNRIAAPQRIVNLPAARIPRHELARVRRPAPRHVAHVQAF